MKHNFKLHENKYPFWQLFVCANCGEVLRIGKWEMRRLLKGQWIYVKDFLPPCSPRVPEVKPSRADRERRMKGYVIGD